MCLQVATLQCLMPVQPCELTKAMAAPQVQPQRNPAAVRMSAMLKQQIYPPIPLKKDTPWVIRDHDALLLLLPAG